MKYRNEIDGLRAIAVIIVVLFHADIPYLTGGFVGVDVFFVLSGFLITTIIYPKIERGEFSYVDFYWRRSKRIFPALFLMLFITSLLSVIILTPTLLEDYSKSLIAATLFSSNIYYFFESGYFARAAEANPLLHTWSLGIEEQYYIFIPVIFSLLARYFFKYKLVTLYLIWVISFSISVWGSYNSIDGAYYLLPSRFWELLSGSILAIHCLRKNSDFKYKLPAQVLGLAMIFIPAFFYSNKTPFPGFSALPPIIGTLLLIKSTINSDSLITTALKNDKVSFIGKVSYSWYLWHWPLLSLAYSYSIEPLNYIHKLSLVILALVISILSWAYVEQPFRNKPHIFNVKRIYIMSSACMALFVFFGALGFLKQGYPERFSTDLAALLESQKDRSVFYSKGCNNIRANDEKQRTLCLLGVENEKPETILVWGDSHAMSWSEVIHEVMLERNVSGRLATWGGCPPLLYWHNLANRCVEDREQVVELLTSQNEITTVILVARWAVYSEGKPYLVEKLRKPLVFEYKGEALSNPELVFKDALYETVEWLTSLNKKVVIIGPTPEIGYNVPESMIKAAVRGLSLESIEIEPKTDEFMKRQHLVFETFESLANDSDITIVYPHQSLCGDVKCIITDGQRPLYYDDDHLGNYGARFLQDYAQLAVSASSFSN